MSSDEGCVPCTSETGWLGPLLCVILLGLVGGAVVICSEYYKAVKEKMKGWRKRSEG